MDNLQSENLPNFGVATSLHGNGLDHNYLPESTENPWFFPVYNTELMVKNFNASKALGTNLTADSVI